MAFTVNRKRLIQSFMNMVRVGSESGQEQEFADYLCHLASSLSLENWQDKYGNVYIIVPGNGRPLMMNTHLDTVTPGNNITPRINGSYIESDHSTILGADSKAGIAGMFEMVTLLHEHNLPHRPLLLTFSRNEEAGIPTAQYIKGEVTECIVPDRGTPVGEIIIQAPYARVFQVTVSGKTAYATTNFTDGRHAIAAAVAMISDLPLGNIDEHTTANIGVIEGGRMTSMIPDHCLFKGNCYSSDRKAFEAFFRRLTKSVKTADTTFGTQSRIEMLEYFPGFSLDRHDPLVRMVENSIKSAGVKPRYANYRAVSNANLLNSIGIKTVLISTGVESQHTVKERIRISSLIALTRILLQSSLE